MQPVWDEDENIPDMFDDQPEPAPASVPAPVFVRKPSLWDLQDQMQRAEEEVNSADDASLQNILGDIRTKVDSVKSMIDIFDNEAARFKDYKDQMAKRQKSLENAAERLRQYTISCLRGHGTEFETGHMWVAKISQNEKVVVHKDVPDQGDYITLGLDYPVIRQKFEWDKTALKNLLKKGDIELLKYAEIAKTDSLTFKPINAAKRS
jgi:hypothetical protein